MARPPERRKHALRPWLAFLFCLLLTSLFAPARLPAVNVGREFLPPEHWCYPALDRFETLGFVHLPMERPFGRDDIVSYVEAIKKEIETRGEELSSRERFELERLEKEFSSETARHNPRERYNPPLVLLEESPFAFEADMSLEFRPEDPLDKERWRFFELWVPTTRFHIGDHLTYEVRYRFTYGPATDERAREKKTSPREKSFRGLTALYERSYLAFQWNRATVYFGRDYVDWGPSPLGNVLVSRTAESLDQLGAKLWFRNFRFTFFHSTLSAVTKRYLAGHRLETRIGNLVFGFSETVLYRDRGFDPVYVLPVSSYYSNQFNERDNDNSFWGVDLKFRFADGWLVYGSLAADDFQAERDDGTPDKLAWDVGATLAWDRPLPVTLRLQYRFVDIFTYSHGDSLQTYIAGTGDLASGDPPLGAPEGPDTAVLSTSASFFPWPASTATIGFTLKRRGEGNDYRKFELPANNNPPFPSGIVEKTYSYSGRVVWELKGNSSASIDVRRDWVKNVNHQEGVEDWLTSVRLSLLYDL